MSKTCTARVRDVEPTETMTPADWLRALFSTSRPCGQPAAWIGTMGTFCQLHAERAASAMVSDRSLIGMALARRGEQPKTFEEAMARAFLPIN